MSEHDTETVSTVSPQLRFARSLNPQQFRAKAGEIYEWQETHWQRLLSREIERQALSWLAKHAPEKANEKIAASCVSTAVLHLPELANPIRDCVPVLNGTIELTVNGPSLRPSRKEDALTYVLNCSFDPSSCSPLFNEFIEGAMPDAEVRGFLQEYSGYTLLSDTRHQLAAWLIGPGGSGKGTFAGIMQALHRSAISLHLDQLDGFKLASLPGASLVLVDETPARIDEQKVKTLVSGDGIQIDIKYRDPLSIRPTAKWIVNGNSLPAISDHSSGFWRRWLIFPFEQKPTRIIPLLGESIVEQELSGVLNWALAGLTRLLARGQFPKLPEIMSNALADGKQSSNNVLEFIKDAGIVTDDKCKNTRKTIYFAYQEWCGESGTRCVSAKKFWERMEEALPEMKIERLRIGGERDFFVNVPLPPRSH